VEDIACAGTGFTGTITLTTDSHDPSGYAKSLGKRIEAARAGESATDFAASIGIHKNTLSRYEHGSRVPDAWLLTRICEQKRLSPTWLLLGVGAMRPSEPASPPEDPSEQPYQLADPGVLYRSLPHEKSRELLQATTTAIRHAEQELGYEIPATWASLMNSLVLLYGMHPEGIGRMAELLKATLGGSRRR
jgi:transcriptional regulator with XRE-family HTH domain